MQINKYKHIVLIYKHAFTDTCLRTFIDTYMQTYVHKYNINTCIGNYILYIHTRLLHIYKFTCVHTYILTNIHKNYVHTYIRT